MARTQERIAELQRRTTSSMSWGIATELLDPAQVKALVPFLDESVILGGFSTPGVGVVDSLRAGTIMRERAQALGALTIAAGTEVTGIEVVDGHVRAVHTDKGTIAADTVVIACGAWSPRIGRLAGATDHRPLRVFELILLEELGYGLELARDAASGEPLEPDQYYHFLPGRGVLAVRDATGEPDAIRGSDMLAVSGGEFDQPAVLAAARRILRAAIGHCLEGRGLHSREVMLAVRQWEQSA